MLRHLRGRLAVDITSHRPEAHGLPVAEHEARSILAEFAFVAAADEVNGELDRARVALLDPVRVDQLIVRGVEYKLQQVFLNLFPNARDAMPKGGWLTIATQIDGADAVIELSDTGVGIPPEHLARIYDPFFTTKPEGRGTGLGLSVTYGIVQEHGGTLACDSAPGQGTRFRLVLPALSHPSVEAAVGR